MTAFANHIWQSTLFAAAVWLLSLGLRHNRAAVRYWLWLSESVKFLAPFSILATIGSHASWRTEPVTAAPAEVAAAISRPFAVPVSIPTVPSPPPSHLPEILGGIWLTGIVTGVIFWVRTAARVREMRGTARKLPAPLPIPVLCSTSRVEPGIFGIFRPVLILPQGLTERLTPDQLDAVFAHELCHVRRKDNFTAAIHLLVETFFWFHPIVWWIRIQLIAERERACDEAVLSKAISRHTYAEAILSVCRLCVETPTLLVSGITGADLKRRIAQIVDAGLARELTLRHKLLLAATACVAVVLPVAAGLLWGQPPPEFDAVSIRPYDPKGPPFEACNWHGDPGRLRLVGCSVRALAALAYDLKTYQWPAGPTWMDSERFVVEAHTTEPLSREKMMHMLQPVLADRFHLRVHWADRVSPVFLLRTAGRGLKLPAATKTDRCGVIMLQLTFVQADCVTMDDIADVLQESIVRDHPVLNRTGVNKENRYRLDIKFSLRDDPDVGASIFDALPDQAGLVLRPGKAPVRTLVIDHAEKPSVN